MFSKHYENPTAKNVGDVFLRHSVIAMLFVMPPDNTLSVRMPVLSELATLSIERNVESYSLVHKITMTGITWRAIMGSTGQGHSKVTQFVTPLRYSVHVYRSTLIMPACSLMQIRQVRQWDNEKQAGLSHHTQIDWTTEVRSWRERQYTGNELQRLWLNTHALDRHF